MESTRNWLKCRMVSMRDFLRRSRNRTEESTSLNPEHHVRQIWWILLTGLLRAASQPLFDALLELL